MNDRVAGANLHIEFFERNRPPVLEILDFHLNIVPGEVGGEKTKAAVIARKVKRSVTATYQ
jgi:hypothetical protein